MRTAILLSIFSCLLPLGLRAGLSNELPLDDHRGEVSRSHVAPEAVDDGWRRTALGWEHQSAWQASPRAASASTFHASLLRPLAYCLIAAGIYGLYLLLLREIDPIEQHAFRIRTNRQ